MKPIQTNYTKATKAVINNLKSDNPQVEHVSKVIDYESMVYLDSELIAVYKKVDFDMTPILRVSNSLKFEPYVRASGLITNTINVNFQARSPLRDNMCRPAKLSYTAPSKHELYLHYARLVARHYQQHFPKVYAQQVKHSYIGKSRIDRNYLIKGTPYTAAVVNKNCAMNYHFDSSNTKNGMSCMLIMKENVSGGELILPELNIGFACQDGFMLLFDGQRFLHGVTAILDAAGYRYTIVYYNNNGMHLCLPPEEEFNFYQNWLDRTK